MKTNKIFLTLFTSIFFASCFSDKGNYEYRDVKEINVSFSSTKYIVTPGETIEIIPSLEYASTVAGRDNLKLPEVTYEWIFNNQVVSTNPTYHYTAGETLGQTKGTLKVRNTETGEQYAGSCLLSIESQYKTGFLILYENENGQGELGFIRSIKNTKRIDSNDYDTLLFVNEYGAIYEKANGFPMLKNPVSFAEHSVSSVDNSGLITEVTLTSENGTAIEDLNGNTFKRETKIQDEFEGGVLPDNFIPKKVVHTEWDSYLLADNGLIYPRRSSNREAFHTGNFFAKFTYNDDTKYSDIFFTLYTETETLLALEIDKDGKRNYVGIYCYAYSATNNGLKQTIVADIGPDDAKELDYITDVKGETISSDFNVVGFDTDIAHTILMKKDGIYYAHILFLDRSSKTQLVIKKNIMYDLSAVTGGKKVLGMSTSKIRPHVYFWDETKVYIYNYEKNTVTLLFDSPTRKITAFGAHTRIRDYDSNSHRKVDASFAVGFETGEVEVYEFLRPDLTGIENGGNYIYKTKNNYGKIKQIDYKLGTSGAFFDL